MKTSVLYHCQRIPIVLACVSEMLSTKSYGRTMPKTLPCFCWVHCGRVGRSNPVLSVVFLDLRAGLGGSNLGKHNSQANLVPQILGFSDSMDVRFLEFSISAAYTFEIDWVQQFKGKSTDKYRRKS